MNNNNIILHGVFLDVCGLGVLLRGNSAIGKSEIALSLINRGHKLIADDAVEFTRVDEETVIGSCPPIIQDFLEVRGLGILNIRVLYGDNAIKASKRLKLIAQMVAFSEENLLSIDRLHGMHRTDHILSVPVPEVTIPVAPGRNLAVLIETAVRNQTLKKNGYNASEEFIARQKRFLMESGDL